MKRTRFTEEQMVKVVKGVDGMPVTEAVRHFGVSRASITIWRKKYAGLKVSEAKRMKDSRTRIVVLGHRGLEEREGTA